MAALDAAGWQVHMHAIGDRAVRSALDAVEFARGPERRPGQPPHDGARGAGPPRRPRAIRRARRVANMQMQWAELDSYTVDYAKPYIG